MREDRQKEEGRRQVNRMTLILFVNEERIQEIRGDTWRYVEIRFGRLRKNYDRRCLSAVKFHILRF